MPKPACLKSPEWTRSESTALELLYKAGWSWSAIAAHVSGIHGHQRSYKGCQSRAHYLGILDSQRQGRPGVHCHDDDLLDLVILGYSMRQIAAELGMSTSWVNTAIKTRISPQTRTAWRKGESERRSRAAQGRRRRAA